MKIFIIFLLFIEYAHSDCAISPNGTEYRLDLHKLGIGMRVPNLAGQLKYCKGCVLPKCNDTFQWNEIYKTEIKSCDESGCDIVVFETLYRGNGVRDSEYESCMIYSMDSILSEVEKTGLKSAYIIAGMFGGGLILCCMVCTCTIIYKVHRSRNKYYSLPINSV